MSGCRKKVTIGALSGEVLLNIFLHCLDDSPYFWPTLVHVCQNWRRIVFTSPLTLNLRLHCKHGTPVLKTLGYWPALPIIVQYGGFPTLNPPSPEDEENVMAALQQSYRVRSISLTITSSLLEKFMFFPVEEPFEFSDLEDLVLLSQKHTGLALPSGFKLGSRLRRLHSTRIALPALPQLLLPSLDLVDLRLHEVPSVGYFSPEAFAGALTGMTQLLSVSLHFLSPASRPSQIGLSPSPGERVVLPALTHIKFRGASEYLNSLVARIDAPGLVDIEFRFFNQLIFHLSELGQFVDRIEMQKSHRRADIVLSGSAASITFTQPETLACLTLNISCVPLDWQLSSMAQICDHLSPILFSVQDLRIDTTERSNGKDEVDDEQWLELVRGFDGAEDFHVAGELATDIFRALRPVNGVHTTVLRSLRKIRVPELVSSTIQSPLRDAVASFAALRRLSGHPVQQYPLLPTHLQQPPIHIQQYPLSSIPGAGKKIKGSGPYFCICHKNFSRPQELNRHIVNKHMLKNVCPYCSVFKWSQGRKYLFKRHLEESHHDIALHIKDWSKKYVNTAAVGKDMPDAHFEVRKASAVG